MRIGIISDVHANLEALEAVLKDMKEKSPDKIIFLGDVVGYGADPNECCEIIKSISHLNIMGNHDAATVDMTDIQWFSENARSAIEYHKGILKQEHKDWIKSFPFIHRFEDIIFSHGSPIEPESFDYVVDPIRASFIMSWMGAENGRVTLVGHAHQIVVFHAPVDDSGYPERAFPEKILFERDKFYVVNVGSVGQPRDGDPRAAYAILDVEKREYELFRVSYDVDRAASKIKKAGLPDFLWQRLYRGI